MYTYIYTWKKKVIIKIPRVNESYSKVNVDVATLTLLLLLRKKKISSSKKKKAHTKPEQPLSPRVHGDRSQREKKSRKKLTATPFSIRDTLRGNSLADPDRPRKGLLPPWRTRERDNEPAPPPPLVTRHSLLLFSFFFLSHVERRQKYRCATICIPGKKIKRKKKGGASGKGETKNEDGARKKRGKKGGIVGKIRIN